MSQPVPQAGASVYVPASYLEGRQNSLGFEQRVEGHLQTWLAQHGYNRDVSIRIEVSTVKTEDGQNKLRVSLSSPNLFSGDLENLAGEILNFANVCHIRNYNRTVMVVHPQS